MTINAAAMRGLNAIYKRGYQFARAGVHLLDVTPAYIQHGTLDLGGAPYPSERADLMAAVDAINQRWGKGAIKLGNAVAKKSAKTWEMRQELLTQQYTTNWAHVPIARAN